MATESGELDEGIQPATEEIHLPDPSYIPATMAFGIALVVVGLVLGFVVLGIGLILFVVTLVMWIRRTREEMAELPLEH